jgi:hypothetical protein
MSNNYFEFFEGNMYSVINYGCTKSKLEHKQQKQQIHQKNFFKKKLRHDTVVPSNVLTGNPGNSFIIGLSGKEKQ